MKRLFPNDHALALARVAYAIGDLLRLQVRFAAQETTSKDEVQELLDTARRASDELAAIRNRLAAVASELPAPAPEAPETDTELSPLELTRASLECILTDRLDPAIAALASLLFPEETLTQTPAAVH
ncbi:MAG TPA: hypothetical protein VMM92_02035 [Thermoanaerobaculia bacterium]|nr:hypothetical protein [Thermoanaerobaculia bacterium]